ncbi:MAG: hypothetical protein R6U63_05250 [Longimicrobiales bacterium]
MVFGEIILAFAIGLLLALIFAYGLGRTGPWGGFVWFFLVVFLTAWAVGLWVEPVGPALWGAAWVPILFGALFVALLVAAIPPRPARPADVAEPDAVGTAAAVGLFFWLLVVILLIAIIFAYV